MIVVLRRFVRAISSATPDYAPGVGRHARAVAARRFRAGIAIGMCSLTGACYNTSQTMTPLPDPAAEFTLELNDQGRIAVATALGPEVKDVSGRLISQTPAELVLSVRDVTYFKTDAVRMQGEQVTITRDQVRSVTERKFSLGRTAILTTAIVVVVGVFIGTKSLSGFGGSDSNLPPPGGNTSLRP